MSMLALQSVDEDTAEENAQGLFEVFERVVSSMAFLAADRIEAGEHALDLSLEYDVRMNGAQPVVLVVRTNVGFAKQLAESAIGEAVTATEAIDSFKELVNVICGNLITEHWHLEQKHFEPFIPVPSRAELWPVADPDGAVAIAVDQAVVEIFYWKESLPSLEA